MLRDLSNTVKSIIAATILSTLIFVFMNSVTNKCVVNFSGKLQVQSRFPSFFGEFRDLPNVPIKITVKTNKRKMVSEFITPSSGGFYHQFYLPVASGPKCKVDDFKVESSFVHGEKLSITKGDWDIIKTWDEVANHKTHQCNKNTCALGDIIFKNGGILRDGVELGLEDNFRQADVWWASMYLIKYVEYLGFPFKDRLKIAYPFDELGSSGEKRDSYANPITRQVQLVGALFDVPIGETLYHEIGHIWSYDYSENAMDLVSYFIFNRLSTHGMLSSKTVAFYEGFAEVFGNYVFLELLKEENKLHGTTEFDNYFLNYGMLRPKALQNFTFDHPKLTESVSEFMDEAELRSWSNNPNCKHHKYGTFDCSDPGWMTILFSLLLENESNDVFDSPDHINLIKYDLMMKYSTSGYAIYMDNYFTNQFCRERPRISFSDLLRSVKGNDSEGLLNASSMTIDGYFSRIRRMELGNITNSTDGQEKLLALKDTLDINNPKAGSFYHNFCDPALFTILYQGDDVVEGQDKFSWNGYTLGSGKAALTFNLFVKPTQNVMDIVTIKTSVENINGVGEFYFREPDALTFFNGSSLTDYKLLNTFDDENFRINTFTKKTRKPVVIAGVSLNPNGSFPITRLKVTPKVGCSDFDNYIYFLEGEIQGTLEFWEDYNCIYGAENSINNFPFAYRDIDWKISGADLYLGADIKPLAQSVFLLPNMNFSLEQTTSLNQQIKNNFEKIAYPFISPANALERKKTTVDKKATFNRQNLAPSNSGSSSDVSLSGPSVQLNLPMEKYIGICRFENVGNVRPGVSTKLRMYTYKGNEFDLMNDREHWKQIKEKIIVDLAPGFPKNEFEWIEIPSIKLELLKKPVLPTSDVYKVSDPVFLICEVDPEEKIDELNEENNISITTIRDVVYLSNNALVFQDPENEVQLENVVSGYGDYSKKMEDLKNLLLKNDIYRANEILQSNYFQDYILINRRRQQNFLRQMLR